jgi:DtxR family transcriptional regulator, Mn-dependent transcriptional regulator
VDTWKEFDQNVITHSAAHHLMAIDELFGEYGYARVSDIARQLNITRGSVSISLQPLKKLGLVLQDENRHLRLSESGRALVAAIRTKRHLMQRLLAEVLGVEAAQAEIDACKLEHLVSNETARQVLSFLRFLDGTAGRGHEFVEAWRAEGGACDRRPEQCPSCVEECLAQRLSGRQQKGPAR